MDHVTRIVPEWRFVALWTLSAVDMEGFDHIRTIGFLSLPFVHLRNEHAAIVEERLVELRDEFVDCEQTDDMKVGECVRLEHDTIFIKYIFVYPFLEAFVETKLV
jgi:hypothetical protein